MKPKLLQSLAACESIRPMGFLARVADAPAAREAAGERLLARGQRQSKHQRVEERISSLVATLDDYEFAMLNEGREFVAVLALLNLESTGVIALTDSSTAEATRPAGVLDSHSSFEDVVAAWEDEEEWWERRKRVVAAVPTTNPISVSHPIEKALYEAVYRQPPFDICAMQNEPDLNEAIEAVSYRLVRLGLLRYAYRPSAAGWTIGDLPPETRLGRAVLRFAQRELSQSPEKVSIGRSVALGGTYGLWATDPLAEVLLPDPEEPQSSWRAFSFPSLGCGTSCGSGC